ncbi:hypothetical protein NDU88_002263 [Pleurodeles waltl]|uniref:Uncharacterized protein n=1 Tax=Pleurodeles waltl TaxID=8319 RepID=A0AAV7P6J2_PLEWA|nr:hypothetical protein NDU88_002263 [Pleurodeles waltl]
MQLVTRTNHPQRGTPARGNDALSSSVTVLHGTLKKMGQSENKRHRQSGQWHRRPDPLKNGVLIISGNWQTLLLHPIL